MKTEERAKARELRKDGWSLKRICVELGVSKGTASRWVRDILLPEKLSSAPRNNRGPEVRRLRAREKRRQWQEEGRRDAKAKDWLHVAGCMLFWAEGARRKNTVRLTNSDPDMVAFFMRFVRESLGVDDEKVSIAIHCHTNNGLSVKEIESRWLQVLGLPNSSLRKTQINRVSKWSKKRGNILKYGTCNVVIHDTRLSQKLHGAIQEYAGARKEDWIDLQ
jgi:hypothetical protein